MSKVTFAPKAAFCAALFAGTLIGYANINNKTNKNKIYTSIKIINENDTIKRKVTFAQETDTNAKSSKSTNSNNTDTYNANANIAIATGTVIKEKNIKKDIKDFNYERINLFEENIPERKDVKTESKTYKYIESCETDEIPKWVFDVDDDGTLIKVYPDGKVEPYNIDNND